MKTRPSVHATTLGGLQKGRPLKPARRANPDPVQAHAPVPRGRERGYTIAGLVSQRVEHQPATTCRGCRHLGEVVRAPDGRGSHRLRRLCHGPCAQPWTDPDWPICAAFERKSP